MKSQGSPSYIEGITDDQQTQINNETSGDTDEFYTDAVKLVIDKNTRVVLGAHMLGSDAPEIMQSIAIAVKAKLKKEDFDLTVGIHPSAAEEFVTMRTAKN